MDNQEIYDLIARFDASGLQALKLSRGDFCIEMEKPAPEAPAAVPVFAPGMVAPAAVPAVTAAPAQEADQGSKEEGNTIDAPLVGTFYAAPAPDKPPFVQEGDRVKKGQTVGLIEAMKTMIEVPAPYDCVIEAVLKANGELASFGEALMRCRPC